MNRDELIEKARAWLSAHGFEARDWEEGIADFALPLLAAERERTVEECARLVLRARVSQSWKLWKVGGVTDSELARADAFDDAMRYEICDAIRALKRAPEKLEPGADKEQPEASADAAASKSTAAEPSADRRSAREVTPPALSDAEILERAADIMERELAPVRGGIITGNKPMVPPSALHVVKSLRATSKLLRARPAAEPDWAEAVALEWFNRYQQRGIIHTAALAALLRERFGPLVEALKDIAHRGRLADRHKIDLAQLADNALSRLRAGAKGERK